MNFIIAVNLISISFFAAIVFTGFLRTLARRYQFLIDLPDKNRKFHRRPTPLIGGLGIHMAMLLGMVILLISVDTKIYDQKDSIRAVNSSLRIIKEDSIEEYKVKASKIGPSLSNSNKFEIVIDGIDDPLIITRNSQGNFELLTPEGELKEYSFDNGYLINLDENKRLAVTTPIESSYFPVNLTVFAVVIMGIFLQLAMLIDDFSGISQSKRILIQSIASAGVIFLSGQYITNIGFGLFGWSGDLGSIGIVFTIFAVTGIINAFNMIDGINGLCSGTALITLLALIFIGGSNTLNYGILIATSSLAGFLIYNLGLFGKKRAVFLGDNGSNFLGFLVAWSCIYYSSESIKLMNPVTALWLVAIPLWDCIHLIFLRSFKGRGAFKADRDHFHHVLFDRTPLSGFLPLIVILVSNVILVIFGIYFDNFQSIYSLITFLIFGLGFIWIKQKLSLRFIKKNRG